MDSRTGGCCGGVKMNQQLNRFSLTVEEVYKIAASLNLIVMLARKFIVIEVPQIKNI